MLDIHFHFRPLDVHGHMVGGGGSDGNRGRRKAPKTFAFDHCFWSMDKDNPKFASTSVVTILVSKILKNIY